MSEHAPFNRRRLLAGLLAWSWPTRAALAAEAPAVPAPLAYVTNQGSDSVSVVDVQRQAVVATIAVGRQPAGIAVSRAAGRAFVTNPGDDNNVQELDAATLAPLRRFAVGEHPFAVEVTPDGRRAFVTNQRSQSVSVIDLAAFQVAATWSVGEYP